jgi:hypothetical protein
LLRDSSKARSVESYPWSLFQSLVVTNMSSRGIPEAATALPVPFSLP